MSDTPPSANDAGGQPPTPKPATVWVLQLGGLVLLAWFVWIESRVEGFEGIPVEAWGILGLIIAPEIAAHWNPFSRGGQ